MHVTTVKNPADLKKFIEFPWKIYASDTLWVPPLISDMRFILGTENPYWAHAEKELFLVSDDAGVVLGRIAAIIDRNYIEFQGEKVGFFGFFECVNDAAAARLLFDAAREWISAKGIPSMMGPFNPSTNDEGGFLCDGFSTPPRLMMPHTPAYYLELAQQCGLKKAKELYAYDMNVSAGPAERLEKLSALVRRKYPGLVVRKLDVRDFEREISKAVKIYNAAWEKNWGFVPWTESEFQAIARRMKDLFLPDTTIIAELNGEPVGMLIAVPDYNFVVKKMNGRLFPFGFLKFLYYRRRIKALRLMIMGVVKEHRQKGIEGVMYCESLKNSAKLGFEKCEFSWILDDNVMTQRAAEMMGGTLYKKYRVYQN